MRGGGTGAARGRRFSKADWLDLGIRELVVRGADGLTVERLCEAAGRTRGSFYHHFADHGVFREALVAEWRERQTITIMRRADADRTASNPDARRAALRRLAGALDHRLDLAMRRWGGANEAVRRAVEAVDAERLAYLTDLYRSLGAGEAARIKAEAEYALFVGAQLLWPDRSAEDLSTLIGEVSR